MPSVQESAYDQMLLGRMPGKRKKPDGLNGRLSRMLLRLNTSFVGESPSLAPKRPRNASNSSSSSTLGPDVPRTPIDDIHNSLKSNTLGDGFAILKAGVSPDKYRSDALTRNELPSWRDVDHQNDPKQENHQRELPDWLSQTFATLESDHPLRALTLSSSSTQVGSNASKYQEDLPTEGPAHTKEVLDDCVFSFTPPILDSAQHDGPQTNLTVSKDDSGSPPAAHNILTEESPLALSPDGRLIDYYSTADDVVNDEPQDKAEEFLPFSRPGPLVQKSVHFLTPVRSSSASLSDSAYNRSRISPTLLPVDQPHYPLPTYNPFSTPGPASTFSMASFDHGSSDGLSAEDHYSNSSTTLADDITAEDDVFAYSTLDDDAAVSVLSFASNTEHLQEKPFSTPGPAFHFPSDGHIYSDPEDYSNSDPAAQIYDEGALEDEHLLANGQQRMLQNTIRFIAKEHEETPRRPSVPDGIRSNKSAVATVDTQEHSFSGDDELYLDRLLETFEPEEKALTSITREAGLDTNTIATVDLFSSPPYVRFTHDSRIQNDEARIPPKESTTLDNYPVSPRYMRFERLPIPAGGLDDVSALPCTPPRSQTQKSDAHYQTTHSDRFLTESNDHRNTEVKAIKERSITVAPEKPKPRPAFAPGPGVYMSPLADSDEAKGHTTKESLITVLRMHRADTHSQDDGRRSHAETEGNRKNDHGTSNASPSQLTDDSIEEWET